MGTILPHTKRFNLIFNKLKAEDKLPSNEILAKEIGFSRGNALTEIKKERQNIGLDNLQKFCDLYGERLGFNMEDFTGAYSPKGPESKLDRDATIKVLVYEAATSKVEIADLKVEISKLKEALALLMGQKGVKFEASPLSFPDAVKEIKRNTNLVKSLELDL